RAASPARSSAPPAMAPPPSRSTACRTRRRSATACASSARPRAATARGPWGGLRGYDAIRRAAPAFLLHSGDLIYADNPILAEQTLPDGRVWRNVTNERVARVAESLDDFRARFAYNLEDDHVRALAQEV